VRKSINFDSNLLLAAKIEVLLTEWFKKLRVSSFIPPLIYNVNIQQDGRQESPKQSRKKRTIINKSTENGGKEQVKQIRISFFLSERGE